MSAPDWAGVLGTAVVVLGFLWAILRYVYPRVRAFIQRVGDCFDALVGSEAVPANPITGTAAREAVPALGQQLTGITSVVEDCRHQLYPNGGGSLADDVKIMKDRMKSGDARFGKIDRRLTRVERMLEQLNEATAS